MLPRSSQTQQFSNCPATNITRMRSSHRSFRKSCRPPLFLWIEWYVEKDIYFLPHMSADVAPTVRNCVPCARQLVGLRRHTQPLELFKSMEPLEFAEIDHLGPVSLTENVTAIASSSPTDSYNWYKQYSSTKRRRSLRQ